MKKCKYFKLYELLPPGCYQDEETGWSLIDDKLKEVIDLVRELVGKPLICNTWYQNGNRRDSGYRMPDSPVGVKLSQHKQGKAADLLCATMTAEQMRKIIIDNADKLPYPVRIEDCVSWLHIDVKDIDYKGKKVYLFKA